MAKIEINVKNISTTLEHIWKKSKGGKDDKHKGKQGKPISKPKQ